MNGDVQKSFPDLSINTHNLLWKLQYSYKLMVFCRLSLFIAGNTKDNKKLKKKLHVNFQIDIHNLHGINKKQFAIN